MIEVLEARERARGLVEVVHGFFDYDVRAGYRCDRRGLVRQEDRLSLDHNKRLRLAESINAWPSLGPTHSHAQIYNLPKSL